MKKLFANKGTLALVICAVVVVGILSFVIINATATQKAAVLTSDTAAGTVITDNMVKIVDVPKDTPGNFKKTKESLVNERLTVNVAQGQLIYDSNVTSGIKFKESENKDFINCTIQLDDDQAMGGLLTAGQKVDIGVVPKSNGVSALSAALPGTSIQSGTFSYILSNVTLLDCTTSLTSKQGGSQMSSASEENKSTTNKNSSYYMFALSYNDYKKLKTAEENGTIYLNMCPKNNEEKAPLLDKMSASIDGKLTDSAPNPIKQEDKDADKKDNKDNNNNNKESNNNNENKNK